MKMADAGVEASLNEGALKRVDPYIKEILDTAKYVALYTFENETWTKTKIEGSLFVYARTAEPLYNILVLNRLDKKNLIEPITPQLDLQRNEPYLLYKNSAGKIFGIWFFDAVECVRLSVLVQNLMEKSVVMSAPVRTNGQVDIFQMLTKAQEAFTSSKPVPERKQSPRELDGTPKSVADFFAKAGTGGGDSKGLPRPKKLSESELLQQLMANPVHSVEHIEMQQRVVTPLSADPGVLSDPLKQLVRPRSMELDQRFVTEPAPFFANGACLTTNRMPPSSRPINANETNGFVSQSLTSSPPGFPTTPIEEAKNPDLMPPAMFTPKERMCILGRASEPTVPAEEPDLCARQPRHSRIPTPEPLTRNQLLQALDYLLRNDPEFMTKIHEAYVKSLTEKIL